MKKKKLIFIIIGVLLFIYIIFVSVRMATAPTDFTVTSNFEFPTFPNVADFINTPSDVKQAVALDNKIIYANTSEPQPTASTTKMILALMVMEKYPFSLGETGETIKITNEFVEKYNWYVANGGSNTAVILNEEISEYDALASVLLASSNNMADSLAIWAFGSLADYQTFASNKLSEWGINDTHIGIDASGFSDTTTSTASDLALIAERLMRNPVLAEIVGLKSKIVPVAGTIENTNKLLGINGIIGVKTGYIGEPSGYCLVTAYQVGEYIITLAVLNADTRTESFSISQTSVENLQQNLKETTLAKSGDEIGYMESWWTGKVPVRINEDINLLIFNTPDTNSTLNISDQTGTLELSIDENHYTFPVTAGDNYQKEPTFWQRFLYANFLN